MDTKKLKEWLAAIDYGILNETIDLPDNTILALPESTSIFTRKRLELLDLIKIHHPQSVQELARITKRTKQAVTRDLKILEKFEIIRLEKKGRESLPLIQREVVVLAIPHGNVNLFTEKKAIGEIS